MSGLLAHGRLWRRLVPILFVCLINTAFAYDQSSSTRAHSATLSLQYTLDTARKNDYGLARLNKASQAFLVESEAMSELPDPTVFAAIQNLPTNSFELDQEPMTQLRVGVRQMFPKGDSLNIKSDMSVLSAKLQLISAKQRWFELKKQTEQAWLEAWYWQKTLALLNEDQTFLEQVQEFIQSLYEVGAKDQSDLIGADLELIKLKEKRIDAKRKYQLFRQQLNTLTNTNLIGTSLSFELPQLTSIQLQDFDRNFTSVYLSAHPKIEAMDLQVTLSDKKADLVAQDFAAAWGIELSYGLRDGENMDGSDRADFFSAGVNLQMPIFSDAKQVNSHQAAKQRANIAQIKRDEAFSQMHFEIESLVQQLRYTLEQRKLYETEIIPTLKTQRKSALQAYESDQGNFRLVINLFLKEQGAKAKHQRLRVNEQKLISSLNYLLGLDAKANATDTASGAL